MPQASVDACGMAMGKAPRWRKVVCMSSRFSLARVVPPLVVAVVLLGLFPGTALAVVNLGTVSVTMQGEVSLDSGTSVTVMAAPSPAYSDQLPNCMADFCPSGCEFGMEGGTGTACLDKGTGQCTCFGYGYSRYYPSCTASSSDPSVARASWGGDVLSIRGCRPGTATVTVYPVMRLFTSEPASIVVTVNEVASPSQDDGGDPTDTPPSGGGTSVSPATPSGEAPSGGGVAARPCADSSKTVSVISSVRSSHPGGAQWQGGGTPDASRVAPTDDGGVASADDTFHVGDEGVSVPELLASVAGGDRILGLWGGDDPDAPQYVWQIPGARLSPDDDLDLDLTVTDVTSDPELARILAGRKYSALHVAHEGPLPGTMQLFWRTAASLPNDAVVDAYTFDPPTGTFTKVYSNLMTAEGYVCLNAAVGGTYVISPDSDLEALGPGGTPSRGAGVAPDADRLGSGVSWVLFLALGVASSGVVIVAVTLVGRARRRVVAPAGPGDLPVPEADAEKGESQ